MAETGGIGTVFLLSILDLARTLLSLYTFLIFTSIILHWLIYFNIINRHQPLISRVDYALYRLTEPVYQKLRRFIPPLGGIDIAPLILLVLLHVLGNFLWRLGLTLSAGV